MTILSRHKKLWWDHFTDGLWAGLSDNQAMNHADNMIYGAPSGSMHPPLPEDVPPREGGFLGERHPVPTDPVWERLTEINAANGRKVLGVG